MTTWRTAGPDRATVSRSGETTRRCCPSWSRTCETNRTQLRQQWAERITDAHLLSAMTAQEVFTEVTSVYDNYVAVLETGSVEELRRYARDLSERIIPRGVETHEVVGIVLLLRDVLARSLFEKYRDDFDLLNRVLDTYEPAANRIANTVAVSFVEQRERVIRQQQDAIRELSTPVLQVRERLLILPIIGVLDTPTGPAADRATPARHPRPPRQGRRHRHHRRTRRRRSRRRPPRQTPSTPPGSWAPTSSSPACPSEIAQTLVTIGVDLSKMNTVGDLQGGIEEAERHARLHSDPDDRN